MRKAKSFISIFACIMMVLGLTACGSGSSGSNTKSTTAQSSTSTGQSTAASSSGQQSQAATGKDTLVVVFSATGTTKGIAERIASMESADLYEITAAQPYSTADLNYNDSGSRSTKEQNDKKARPEISSKTLDLSGYKTIYIGYPIWWGEEPRIMDTFVESYNFGNITMIPFCTSGGSGIGRSGKNLAENAGSGNWKAGDRLQTGISDADLKKFIESNK